MLSSSRTTTPIPLSRETSDDNRLPASLERSNSHLVSNARGPFPRLEMVSVPRRSATLPGGKRGSEDFVGRAVLRVSRRLADVRLISLFLATHCRLMLILDIIIPVDGFQRDVPPGSAGKDQS